MQASAPSGRARRRRLAVDPFRYPSERRIRALGLSMALGHPIFYLAWAHWLPQPYESLWQRALMSGLGLVLLTAPQFKAQPPSQPAAIVMTGIFWITLPVYFTWMYLCNGASAVWLAMLGAMVLIYYHLTDWRIATLGIVTGMPTGWLLFRMFGFDAAPPLPPELAAHAVILLFAWCMGLVFGISSINPRREQLKQALRTMEVIAHEMRTPLATLALIGDAMRAQSNELPPQQASTLDRLATRLNTLVRNMNLQIDTQMTNAQLMHLPEGNDILSAAVLVRGAVCGFPYRSDRERTCVQVQVIQDFSFRSSGPLFHQVIDNLLKNALRSLAAQPTPAKSGDLTITIDVAQGRRGVITLTDRGSGVSLDMQAQMFQLFASTHRGTGHGLGLPFCDHVIRSVGGSIRVDPSYGPGARFIIELPLAVTEPIAQRTLERILP